MGKILRGDILWADLNPIRGNEQAGHRPVLVISEDIFNERSGTVIALAITSQPQKPDLEGWFALKNANGVTYSSMSVINVSSLITYKGMALLNDPQNVWMLSQTKTPYWFVCANAPSPAASSLAVFNGTLYFVSATGIYKAIN